MTDHKEWNSKAEEMIELLELDDHKMINFLADLGGIVGSIKLMESRYPRFREILRSIIDL